MLEGVRRSFREHTWEWLATALASGLLLVRVRGASGKRSLIAAVAPQAIKSRVGGVIARTFLTVAQPYLALLVQRLVEHWVSRSSAGPAPFEEPQASAIIQPWRQSSSAS